MSWSRLLAMARKEAIQIRRDVRSLVLAFVLPLLLLVFFGYAITLDVKDIELVVLDHARSQDSRTLVEALARSGYFTVVERIDRLADADDRLARGAARAVMVIPPDFSSALAGGTGASVQLLVDGADANTATIALGYADAIVSRYAGTQIGVGSGAATSSAPTRIWYNETLESEHVVIPGLIAVIMSIIAAMLTALTIAREWERGTMEQLAATPVHRTEVVLGKLVPYIGIGLIDVTIAVVVGVGLFGVPFRGSVVWFALLSLLFLIGVLGLGMFISAKLKSQVLATQVALMATYLPALLLSGFLFAIANMPVALRVITYAIPARYFVSVVRGIFLKGVGPVVLWSQGLAMAAFAVVGLTLAVRSFRKEIA